MANVKISILTEFLGKGIKDANKSVRGLEKSVKNLSYIFGGGYLGAKVLAFSKTAVMAFAADDKAAKTLSKTLTNLGLAFEDVRVSNFISEMERTYGILDDQLRPAFQKLLTTTGSVSEAQKALKTALDLSAASGIDVVSVSDDLSKAYVGQTRGLAKYGLGLSQAQLKGMKFEEVQARITKLFGGQAALAADSYSGKINKLNVAADQARETIGKGLVDALGKAFGSGTGDRIDNTTKKMQKLSQVGSGIINTFADVFQATFDTKAYLEQSRAGKPAYKGATPAINAELAKKVYEDRMKAIREEQLAADKLTRSKKQQLALDKAKASLAKAQANFDITKINLAAALKGKVTEDEKNRLMALQAIENGNGEEALKWIAKIDAARAQAAKDEEERQNALHASIMAKLAILNSAIQAKQAALFAIAGLSMGGTSSAAASSASQYSIDTLQNLPYGQSYYAMTGRDAFPVNVTVNLDGQTVGGAVSDVLTNSSNSGISSTSSRPVGAFSAGYYR